MPPEADRQGATSRGRRGGPWLIVLVALVGGAGGLMAGRWASTPAPQPQPPQAAAQAEAVAIGDPVEGIALPGLDGQPVDLADFRGRPLLVNFWATWCAPCVKEMPLLDDFARGQAPDGVQVLGIALDQAGAVRDFLGRVPVAYPIALDAPGPADSSVRLGNTRGVLPYSALLDADGRLLATHVGDFDAAELDAFVSALPGRR